MLRTNILNKPNNKWNRKISLKIKKSNKKIGLKKPEKIIHRKYK